MINKKLRYISYLQLYRMLNLNKDNFFYIGHINYLNSKELNILNTLLKKKNINSFRINSTLLKKSKNNEFNQSILRNLLSGPSIILVFKTLSSLIKFEENKSIKNFILPLAIFKDTCYFPYQNFFNYITINKKSLNNRIIIKTIITTIFLHNRNFLINLKLSIFKFLILLNKLQ
jgi:hypothetical protein